MRNDESKPAATAFHPSADPDWLALRTEAVIDPDLPVIDAHHHLFDRPEWRYDADALLRDLSDGHRVVGTVYLECREGWYTEGPTALRPVGETARVESVARRHAASGTGLCAAIIGHADLSIGAAVENVLHAHLAAAPTRFRGIRHSLSHDDDPAFNRSGGGPRPARAHPDDPAFRQGFARLAPLGLSFDAWLYHPQLDGLLALARAFPDTCIVLNHVGGPLGIGAYAGRRDEIFRVWQASIRALADCPNVVVKLGGLGMRLCGFGFESLPTPPDSAVLADAWRPYVATCIDAFGVSRCMFESNFPVDQACGSYRTVWNAFKRLAANASDAEKTALFSGTAARVYRI